MIKTVFFDLGNTLVDYHTGKLTDEEKDFLGLLRMHQKLLHLNCTISFDELYTTFYDRWMLQCTQRNTSTHEFDILAFMPFILTNKEKMDLVQEFHEPAARFAVSMNGVMDAVRELKCRGITLGIISNTPVPGICHDTTLKRLGLIDYFPNRFYSYDLGIRKPHCDIFLHALRMTGSDPSESLMIGDRLQLDILPALQIGMHGLLFLGNNKSVTPDNHVQTLDNYNELLQKIECL